TELLDNRIENLRLLDRLAHADVQHDLLEVRDLVHILQAELLGQVRAHRLRVVRAKARLGRRLADPRVFLGRGGLRRLTLLAAARLLLLAGVLLAGVLLAGVLLAAFLFVLLSRRHLSVSAQLLPGRVIASPDFTLMRSFVPSVSIFARMRVGAPDFGSSSITLDACSGAGISMIPDVSSARRALRCFFTMFTPSIVTRPVFVKTRMILPSLPLSSPRTTRTVSPRTTWTF